MKFKEIEPKRNSVAPELEATPYVLSEEEQKMVAGGMNDDACSGILHMCGMRGKNYCEPFSCPSKRYSCSGRREWREELSLVEE